MILNEGNIKAFRPGSNSFRWLIFVISLELEIIEYVVVKNMLVSSLQLIFLLFVNENVSSIFIIFYAMRYFNVVVCKLNNKGMNCEKNCLVHYSPTLPIAYLWMKGNSFDASSILEIGV